MARAYTLTDWDTHGPRVLELKKAGKSFKAIEEIIGVKQEAIRAWFNKQAKVSPAQEPPMNIQFDPLPTDPVTVLEGQMSLDADTVDQVSVSTTADTIPVNHEVDGPLSPMELQTLEHYERIIDQGIKTFVQVGEALLTIREERLYRETYTTFETYLRERWNLDRSYAHRMIDAAQVVENLLPIGNILPVNESQTRPLTSLPPAQQVEVWREVVETAPPSGITAKHVQTTVNRAKGKPTTPTIGKGQAEQTRERLSERGQPNHNWINVLSQAHRLSAALCRLPEREAVFESWGTAGRQKAIDYLSPLSDEISQLIGVLHAIDAKPSEAE